MPGLTTHIVRGKGRQRKAKEGQKRHATGQIIKMPPTANMVNPGAKIAWRMIVQHKDSGFMNYFTVLVRAIQLFTFRDNAPLHKTIN